MPPESVSFVVEAVEACQILWVSTARVSHVLRTRQRLWLLTSMAAASFSGCWSPELEQQWHTGCVGVLLLPIIGTEALHTKAIGEDAAADSS